MNGLCEPVKDLSVKGLWLPVKGLLVNGLYGPVKVYVDQKRAHLIKGLRGQEKGLCGPVISLCGLMNGDGS